MVEIFEIIERFFYIGWQYFYNVFLLSSLGEIQYRQRIEDIRLLKLEIKKLRREKYILTKSVANVEELRREVYNMQRELLRERTRCKALEEELENPMNIHRWRKLEVKTFPLETSVCEN